MKPKIFMIYVATLAPSFAFVVIYQCYKATKHSVNAFDDWVDMFFYGFAVVIAAVGIITLLKTHVPFKLIAIATYFLLTGGSFVVYNVATAEDNSPVILQGSTGDAVGGLCLMFRKDSTFRIINSGGVGYDWEEGQYSLHGNKIWLSYKDKYNVANLNREIVISADNLNYSWVGDTAKQSDKMMIVLNNLNKK